MKWTARFKLGCIGLALLTVVSLVASTFYSGHKVIDVYLAEAGQIVFPELNQLATVRAHRDALRNEVYKALTYSFSPSVGTEQQIQEETKQASEQFLQAVRSFSELAVGYLNQEELTKMNLQAQGLVQDTQNVVTHIYNNKTQPQALFSYLQNYEFQQQKFHVTLQNLNLQLTEVSEAALVAHGHETNKQVQITFFSLFVSLALGVFTAYMLVKRYFELISKETSFINSNAKMTAATKHYNVAA